MFGESMLITRDLQRRPHRWVTLTVSIFIHSFFAATLVIAPLMDADAEMPRLTIEHIFLGSPPPPEPPPPPSPGNPTGNRKGAVSPKPEPKRADFLPLSNRLVTPIDIPENIPDETAHFFSEESGGPYVPGAATGWGSGTFSDLSEIFGKDQIQAPQPASTTPAGLIITPPRLLRRITPDYPQPALKSRITGKVIIEAETDVYGRVIRCKASSGHALLIRAAEEAVKKWLYEPYIINGIPRPVRFVVEIHFTLN